MKGAEPIFIDKNSKVGILMLHGFTSTPHQFKEMAVFLSDKGFSVYAPLIAGHGTSPADLMETTSADWTNSVMTAYLKLKQNTEKVVVIGSSFGGNLAFWLAQETANALSGVISFGTPIFLRFQWFIMFRYWLYGRFKKYYRKPPWAYKMDSIDMADEVTYLVIPIKSLKRFLDFVKNDTMPNLRNVTVPVLISHTTVDPIAHPKSADFIYRNIGSTQKEIYWVKSRRHAVVNDDLKNEMFDRTYQFIKAMT